MLSACILEVVWPLILFLKLDGTNYQTWKVRIKLLPLKEGTWKYVNPNGRNPPVAKEAATIVAERVGGLHLLFMPVKENVFSNLSECMDPIVAWTLLSTMYRQTTNADKLMLKDRLNTPTW